MLCNEQPENSAIDQNVQKDGLKKRGDRAPLLSRFFIASAVADLAPAPVAAPAAAALH